MGLSRKGNPKPTVRRYLQRMLMTPNIIVCFMFYLLYSPDVSDEDDGTHDAPEPNVGHIDGQARRSPKRALHVTYDVT